MSQNATKALGKRIKAIRLAKPCTQAQLAEMLGCEPMTISRYERGSYAPSIEALEQMAQALGCSMASFFSETPKTIASGEPSRDELRHYLSDLIYEVSDRESLKEIATLANDVITRRRKARKR